MSRTPYTQQLWPPLQMPSGKWLVEQSPLQGGRVRRTYFDYEQDAIEHIAKMRAQPDVVYMDPLAREQANFLRATFGKHYKNKKDAVLIDALKKAGMMP